MLGSVGMSLLITKSPPTPPCFFPNHSIKEMSAPKPYPACFPYTQVSNLGLLLVAFLSRLLSSEFTNASLQCAGKQEWEDHPVRKNPPATGAQTNPSATQPLWAFPLFLLERKLEKNPPSEPYQSLGRAVAQGKRDQLFPVGKISSDQCSLKYSHLSHLAPSPSLKKDVHRQGSSWKLSETQCTCEHSNEMCV